MLSFNSGYIPIPKFLFVPLKWSIITSLVNGAKLLIGQFRQALVILPFLQPSLNSLKHARVHPNLFCLLLK